MSVYWDSSALIEALSNRDVRDRLQRVGGVTRTHTMCEIFSILTGGRLGMRVDGNTAAKMIDRLCLELKIIDLSSEEMLEALSKAKDRGVHGGRVYDYIHAAVADVSSCERVYTLNVRDFEGLFDALMIMEP